MESLGSLPKIGFSGFCQSPRMDTNFCMDPPRRPPHLGYLGESLKARMVLYQCPGKTFKGFLQSSSFLVCFFLLV